MWLRFQRVPEKDEEIDVALSDHCAHLLVSSQRTTHKGFDLEAEILLQPTPCGPRGVQDVLRQHLLVMARP